MEDFTTVILSKRRNMRLIFQTLDFTKMKMIFILLVKIEYIAENEII
jgi:hypothetical protein